MCNVYHDFFLSQISEVECGRRATAAIVEPILKGTEAWLVPVPAMADEQILRAQNATYALLDSQAPVPNCCVHCRPGL